MKKECVYVQQKVKTCYGLRPLFNTYANFDFVIPSFSDIEVANRHGHTCLMIACYKGHLKIAKYLIDAKADVNRKSVKGNTALHDCAESGSLEIMKLLLANGAKIDVDAYGMNLNFLIAKSC